MVDNHVSDLVDIQEEEINAITKGTGDDKEHIMEVQNNQTPMPKAAINLSYEPDSADEKY